MTEVVHPPVDASEESLLNAVPVSEATETKSRLYRAARGVIGSLAVAAVVVAPNAGEINRWKDIHQEGSIVPEIPGCETLDLPPQTPLPPPDRIERQVEGVESAAKQVDTKNIDILEVIGEAVNFFEYPQTSFVSDHSGINFKFYSNVETASWELHERNFDDAFHAHLLTDLEYANPHITNVIDCLKQRVLDDREFAGQEYKIYIHNSPNYCAGDGRIINMDEEPDTACQQRGFTPPKLQVRFLFWERSELIMILTGAGQSGDELDAGMSRLVMHEAGHALLSISDTKIRMNADERWVRYHDRRTLAELGYLAPVITFNAGTLTAEHGD